MRENVFIIGAGGHGGELVSYVRDMVALGDEIRLVGFIDENRRKGAFCGAKVLGSFRELRAFLSQHRGAYRYITAAGDNQTRLRLVKRIERLHLKNLSPWTLQHPTAVVGQDVVVGEGSCLTPESIVTTRAKIGKHCILNVKASVSHDCVIGDWANINPGATICGNVRIGKGCYIGAGATVIDKVSIGDWTVVGAGAVVVGDIPPQVTAVGVPARIIKKHTL